MPEHKQLLNALTFHIVDGLYLQDNDVEHEDYVLIADLTEWMDENERALTRADVTELAIPGGLARRSYSIYDKFVDVPTLLDQLAEPAAEPAPEPLYRASTQQITDLKTKMSDGKTRFEGGTALVEVRISDFNELLAIAYHYEAETARLKGVSYNGQIKSKKTT